MTQITRVYDNASQANAAMAELKQRGFKDVDYIAASKSSRSDGNGVDLIEPIRRTGVSPSHAEAYAERVRRGGAVISVRAPFGTATTVTGILNQHGQSQANAAASNGSSRPKPGSDNAPRRDGAAEPESKAAPLSSALDVPVLAESSSGWFGTKGSAEPRSSGPKTLSQMLGIPELIDSNTFFSGFPLLIRSRPFSSLAASQEPYSSLSKSQEPSAEVIDDPAPLSKWIGMPVLLKGRRKR
ncbi:MULTISPECIES: hypothetical protein [Rhodopseudomonas]|uniref:hypothetical protein n=1 Tax=Rhodopseudomonas TaxID=1073 RepID=UPI000695EBFA|nr:MULTISPECIES: hypothetical protein [Rhodopseudomonas]MDF3810993.1 hypothetical protein [Rhodopseudomonas sp. BAL398]WOK15892.1 hypothetical protein RBJ75_17145 [Rhodopseudomonas sp. BAL398]